MRRLISAVCAATFMASANIAPAAASPLVSPPRPEANQSLIQTKSRCRRCYRSGNRYYSKRHYSNRRYSNRHYKKRRYSYRRYPNYYNYGWWGIPGVVIGGAIVGSLLYQPPYYRSYGDGHIEWCYRHYRSYRPSDNTFQPYHGPRRPCISPYRR